MQADNRLMKIDIPNLTYNNIHYGEKPFIQVADLQAMSK